MRHTCNFCHESYSRNWVLKRHLLDQHGIQHLADSRSMRTNRSNQTAFPTNQESFIPMMYLYDLIAKKQPVQSTMTLAQINLLATKQATNMIKPIYDRMQKQNALVQDWLHLYIPFPKVLVSGFSCYLCKHCATIELPIPIKDRGVDLTCEGRHRCRMGS